MLFQQFIDFVKTPSWGLEAN